MQALLEVLEMHCLNVQYMNMLCKVPGQFTVVLCTLLFSVVHLFNFIVVNNVLLKYWYIRRNNFLLLPPVTVKYLPVLVPAVFLGRYTFSGIYLTNSL